MDNASQIFKKWLQNHPIYTCAFIMVFVYRMWLCSQAPEDTSDLFRNLGYSSHLMQVGSSLYSTSPSDFKGEFWTQFWGDQSYIYPPVTLTFFSLFSVTGAGLFFIKAFLTILDFISAAIIGALAGPLFGLLVFSAPVALWYTSHEGQFESLLNFTLLLAAFFSFRKKWGKAGFSWVLALQVKQFAVLLAPYFISEIIRSPKDLRWSAAKKFVFGSVIGLIPFLPFYMNKPDLYLLPLRTQQFKFNPFAWNFTDSTLFGWNPQWLINWNAVTTYGILVALCVYLGTMMWIGKIKIQKLNLFLDVSPLALFLSLLKTLTWAQFWYMICAPALCFPFLRFRKFLFALLVLLWIQDGRSLALLTGPAFGVREYQQTIDRFQGCIWKCDYQQQTNLSAPTQDGDPSVQSVQSESFSSVQPEIIPSDGADTFTVNLSAEPATLNPISGFDNYSREVLSFVMDSLLDRDPDSNAWKPALAEKFERSADGKSIKFTLRKGVRFHDHQPLTADDVKFSFDVMFDSRYNAAHARAYFENIERVEVVSPLVVLFRTKGKYFADLDAIAKLPIVPKHFYEITGTSPAKKSRDVIGSGPYKLEKYIGGQSILLVKNQDWWGIGSVENKGRFNFERIRFRFDGDENVAIERLTKGEIDYDILTPEAYVKKAIGNDWGDKKKVAKWQVENKAPKGFGYIGWNLRRDLFKDRNVRLALYHLLNREEMNRMFRFGFSLLATGPWYQQSEYASARVKPILFNQKKAAELLRKAGWRDRDKDGTLDKQVGGVKRDFHFTLIYGHADQEKYWVLYQADLKKVGIRMDLQRLEWNALMKKIDEKDFDATALAWGGGAVDLDPKQVWHTSSIGAGGSNFIGYSNPIVDKLIDQARAQLDKSKRVPLYRKIYELIAADVPYAFLFNDRYTLYAQSTRLKMMKPTYNYRIGTDYWSFREP
jgi:peptide/nickel transport system substrate-binding protein/microcin C transport system substrate-binding protein